MGLIGVIRRHRAATALATSMMVLVAAFGLYWFAPWKLWTNTTVNDEIPVVAAADLSAMNSSLPRAALSTATPAHADADESEPATNTKPATTSAAVASATSQVSSGTAFASSTRPTNRTTSTRSRSTPLTTRTTPVSVATLLTQGTLISHEHETSGTARIIRLADSSRILTLEGLSTSDGPDVHVWLAAAPVVPGESGWYLFDDDAHVDLGRLKGNRGNQVYQIADDIDLSKFGSVTLWCERFSVSFGAAALH